MKPSFIAAFTLAQIGAYVGFMPLFQVLLPLKAEVIDSASKAVVLSQVAILGSITASFANLLAGAISDRTTFVLRPSAAVDGGRGAGHGGVVLPDHDGAERGPADGGDRLLPAGLQPAVRGPAGGAARPACPTPRRAGWRPSSAWAIRSAPWPGPYWWAGCWSARPRAISPSAWCCSLAIAPFALALNDPAAVRRANARRSTGAASCRGSGSIRAPIPISPWPGPAGSWCWSRSP